MFSSCLESRRRGVAGAYAVFDTPTIGPGSYGGGGKAGTTLVSIPAGYALDSTIASFVGFAPVEDRALIMLVKFLVSQTATR